MECHKGFERCSYENPLWRRICFTRPSHVTSIASLDDEAHQAPKDGYVLPLIHEPSQCQNMDPTNVRSSIFHVFTFVGRASIFHFLVFYGTKLVFTSLSYQSMSQVVFPSICFGDQMGASSIFHRSQCASYGYRSCFADERWRGVRKKSFGWYFQTHDGSMGLVYFPTFTIEFNQMKVNIPIPWILWFQMLFIFTQTWGDDPIWLYPYFWDGLVQPPPGHWVGFCWRNYFFAFLIFIMAIQPTPP